MSPDNFAAGSVKIAIAESVCSTTTATGYLKPSIILTANCPGNKSLDLVTAGQNPRARAGLCDLVFRIIDARRRAWRQLATLAHGQISARFGRWRLPGCRHAFIAFLDLCPQEGDIRPLLIPGYRAGRLDHAGRVCRLDHGRVILPGRVSVRF